MPRPYDPGLLDAILSSMPLNAKVSKIYYLPTMSVNDNYDQIPVLLPKSKADEIIRWLNNEASKVNNPANKLMRLERSSIHQSFMDPTAFQDGIAPSSMLLRNKFTVPDSLD